MGLGGWLKKRWGKGPSVKGLKSSIKGTGKFAGNLASEAANVVSFVPGVGRLVAPLLKTGGQLLKGRSLGHSLGAGAKTLAFGELGKLGGSVLGKIPGASKIGDMAAKVPGLHALSLGGDVAGDIGLEGGDIAGSGDRFRGIGGFLKDNAGGILDGLETAGNIYGNYQDQGRKDDYAKLARDEYAKRAPLRDAAMQQLLDQSQPDTSAIFNDPFDPQSRYRRVRVGSRV